MPVPQEALGGRSSDTGRWETLMGIESQMRDGSSTGAFTYRFSHLNGGHCFSGVYGACEVSVSCMALSHTFSSFTGELKSSGYRLWSGIPANHSVSCALIPTQRRLSWRQGTGTFHGLDAW